MNSSKILLTFLFCSTFFASVFAQHEYETLVSVEKLQEDLAVLKQNLQEVHPGLYTYHSKEKINSFFTDLSQDIKQPTSAISFYRRLLPILQLIANNHTKIKCPESYENALANELPRIPLRLYANNGKFYVHEDLSDEQDISLGSEILNINGVSSGKILSDMIQFDTPDGFNLSHSIYGIGAAFSRRYGYYFGTPENYEVVFLKKDGTPKNVMIKGLKATVINAKRENLKLIRAKEVLQFSVKNDIGHLRIPSFQPKNSGAYRKKLRQIFQKLKERGTKTLVIDVRRNGGGYGEAVSALVSYLIDQTIFPYKDEYALVDEIPYPQYYKKDMFFKHFKKQPLVKKGEYYHIKNIRSQKINFKKNAFKGKLYILMDGASASATGEFLGLAKSYTEAIFIGQESGGNPAETTANDLLHMTLPNSKVRVTIPALRSVMNITFENIGRGVIPDYEVIPTIADILGNRDVVLDFTLQKIRSTVKARQ